MSKERLTLGNVLTQIADTYADRTAIIFDDVSFTYEELKMKSVILADHLIRLGVKKDHKVAVIMSNCIEYVFTYYALFLIGAWVVPVSIRYEKDELRNILLDSDISTIIYEKHIDNFNYLEVLEDLNRDLPLLKNHIVLSQDTTQDDMADNIDFSSLLTINKDENFNNVLKRVLDGEALVDEDGIALLAYTSGTTGTPKGVMIPHKNFIVLSRSIDEIWKMDLGGISFSVAPLYAAQGFMALLLELISGLTIRWNSSFVPNDVIGYLKDKNVTGFHTQPTVWNLLFNVPYFHHLDLTHIERIIVSGSLCPLPLAEKIRQVTQGKVLNAYGLVEATGIATITHVEDPEEIRFKTVGRPLPGIEMKIVDKNRHEVKKGEIGEIALKGFLMKGYYKKEEKTREVIDDDGWLYTGDLACYYDDKNISIMGRCKDMVIRGAFNVYPIDIEECLLRFEKVEDVAVIGKTHELFGECLVAFVIPKPSCTLTEGEIMKFCRGKIANYKVPDEVIFVSQFPILLSGKVRKDVLREWAENRVPEERLVLFKN